MNPIAQYVERCLLPSPFEKEDRRLKRLLEIRETQIDGRVGVGIEMPRQIPDDWRRRLPRIQSITVHGSQLQGISQTITEANGSCCFPGLVHLVPLFGEIRTYGRRGC